MGLKMQAGIALVGRRILAVFTALCMVTSLFVMFAGSAQADHIPSTGQVPDNCVEFGVGDDGPLSPTSFPEVDFSVTSWADTPQDPHTVEFTISGLAADEYVDISVKMGQTVEEDGPYYNGSHTILSEGQGVSHIRMCVYEVEVESKIVVKKEVTEGSDTTVVFNFTASYDADGFTMVDGQRRASENLTPGTYSVAEIVPDGWSLVSATCDDGSDPAEISLEAGETVLCVFINEELPPEPEPGNIIVVKEVTDGSDTEQLFDFTADYDNDGFSLADGDQNDSGDLEAGTYAVSETVLTGWSQVGATCDDGSDPAAIDLAGGETVTCTFVNQENPPEPEPGNIIVVKEVTDGSDTEQLFDFTADYDNDGFSLADGDQNDSGDLDAGTYAVSETVPDGWTQESATCDDGSDPSAIDLAAGETVTCTFVNEEELPPNPTPPGTIVVEKEVVGEGSQEFEFTFETGGFTLPDSTLAHGQSSSTQVEPGDGYSVDEVVPDGWELISATCDDNSDPSNIDVASGETVTCTFVNMIPSEVEAAIFVTATGTCELDGNDGQGVIQVSVSVDGGADVVIRNSDGDVVATVSADATIEVPEGDTYTWEATPNEGFEFPVGADSSGSVTIETCSNPETLPFTGIDNGPLAAIAMALGLLGGLILFATRDPREN